MFCRALRDWRLRARLSQRELSRKLGKPITYASKVEARKRRRLDAIDVADWARACDVPVADVADAIGP